MAAAAQRSVVMVASKRLGLLFVSGKKAGGLVVQVVLPQISPLSGRPERWAKQVRHMYMCSRTAVVPMYGLSMTRWCGCSFGSRHSVSAHPQPAAECQSGRTASAHRCVHQSVLEDYRTSSARAHSQAFLMVLASYSPSDGKSAPMRARSFHSQHENNARERCSQKSNEMMSRVGGMVFHVQGPKRCCAVAARCVAF